MEPIKITSEYICLGQLLKYVGIISNGAEAKIYLANKKVYVNDILDNRRGKKIYPGDVVRLEDKLYKIE